MAVAQHRALAVLAIAAIVTGAASAGIRELALTHNFVARNLASKSFVHFAATVKTDPVWGAAKVVGSRTKAPSQSLLVTVYQITINGKIQNLSLIHI